MIRFSRPLLYVLAVSALPISARGQDRRVTVIDPAHGGVDRGAAMDDRAEKDVTLRAAAVLAGEISARGGRTVLTRSSDTLVPLDQRGRLAHDVLAFVSLHAAASRDSTDAGIVVWLSPTSEVSRPLAALVAVELADLDVTVAVREADFAVLRGLTTPAVVVELGFLTNHEDRVRLRSTAFQAQVAERLANAIGRLDVSVRRSER